MFSWRELSFPVKLIIIVLVVAIVCGLIVWLIIWLKNRSKQESFEATNTIEGEDNGKNVVAAFCQSWIKNIKKIVSSSNN